MYIAVAPLAKLTTPEPRNVKTTPRAMAAYRAPDPVPPSKFCNCSLALVGLRTMSTTIRTMTAPPASAGLFTRRPTLGCSGLGWVDRGVVQRVGHRDPLEAFVLLDTHLGAAQRRKHGVGTAVHRSRDQH